jgi:Protein of unknown function (DUF1573)
LIIRSIGHICSVLLLAFALSGCSDADNAAPSRIHVNTLALQELTADSSYADESASASLAHDFGIAPPNSQLIHRFQLHNPSKLDWVVERLDSSCSCTVPRMSATTIKAGATEIAEVLLKTGESSIDVKREVVVVFADERVPSLHLQLKANVRSAMTPVPALIRMDVLSKESIASRVVQLQNFTLDDWTSVHVKSAPKWAAVKIGAHPVKRDRTDLVAPREFWNIWIAFATADLQVGRYAGDLVLAANEHGLTCSVPLEIQVVPRLTILPKEFFFGPVGRGQTVVKQLNLTFAGDGATPNPSAVSVKSSSPALFASWSKQDGCVWTLTASLHPDGSSKFIKEQVHIIFHDARLGAFTIPVIAIVD